MAVGRMLNKCISLDKTVNDLPSDACRLAFTWTLSHLDRDGRIHGDPGVLRAIVFPRRSDISAEDWESFILAWAQAGLVQWYEAEGDKWLSFPNFRKNQPRLPYDREAESKCLL